MDALVYCLDSLGDSLGGVVLRHVAEVVWKVSMKISDSLLLFFQGENTQNRTMKKVRRLPPVAHHAMIAASGESCCTVPGRIDS